MGKEKVFSFINRNLVTIVMVPVLVGIHWGWNKIQDVEVLVSKEEKKDLPIVLGTRYIEQKLEEKIASWKTGDEIIPEK